MKTASDLVVDIGYLKAVIDAADFIDDESVGSGDMHKANLVTSLIYIAAAMAGEMQNDIENLAK